MRQLNKVILLGRLAEAPVSTRLQYGKPIETQTLSGRSCKFPTPPHLENGTALAAFRLNSRRSYIDRSGERRVEECGIDVLAHGGTAEVCCQYLNRGMQALVEGRLAYHQWQSETGETRSKHCLIARSVQHLGWPDGGTQELVPEFNNAVLLGNLAKDPTLYNVGDGRPLALLKMVSTRDYNTPSGERMETVCYIDVKVWNRSAELCCKYLSKGRQILVEGTLQYDAWEAPKRNRQPRHQMNARAVQFLDIKRPERVQRVAEEGETEIYFMTDNLEGELYESAVENDVPM